MDENLPPRDSGYGTPPPISTSPPPLMPPPPPPRRRKSGGSRVWLALLLIVAGFVLLAIVGMLFSDFSPTARQRFFKEVVIEHNQSANKLLVVDLEGIITSRSSDRGRTDMVELFRRQLKRAGRDSSVKAVVLRINSPGGEVLASDDINREIVDFQKKTGKPVVASMSSLAASGGYYVAAPCQWIVANELTITGSIGVIMQGLNYRTLMDKVGLSPVTYKSGDFKDMLSGARRAEDVPEEEREMVQNLIMETYGRFTNVVAQGRTTAEKLNNGEGRALSPQWTQYVDGRIFTGRQAYEMGFVDELGGFNTAVERARKLADIANANLVQYQPPMDWSSLFSLFGEAERTSIKLDLGMEFPRLQAGYLYFITPLVLR